MVINWSEAATRLRYYCLGCKDWVRSSHHECTDKTFTLVDSSLVGVVNRLYSLGITPITSLWSICGVDLGLELLKCIITVVVDEDVYMEVLGELPTGWHYVRDEYKAAALEFVITKYWGSCDEAKIEVLDTITRFEEFLDSKDALGIRSVMLLSGI